MASDIVGLMLVLPRLAPFEFLTCSPIQGGTGCVEGMNTTYPIMFFLLSVCGTVFFFLGLFGKSFVLNPLFILGLILVEWGSAGLAFGYLHSQWCASEASVTCIVINPDSFLGALVGGVLLISLQSALRLRTTFKILARRISEPAHETPE